MLTRLIFEVQPFDMNMDFEKRTFKAVQFGSFVKTFLKKKHGF